MMLFISVWLLQFLKQSTFMCLLYNYKETNPNDLKEIFSHDIVDLILMTLNFPGRSGKICFSQPLIMWFRL